MGFFISCAAMHKFLTDTARRAVSLRWLSFFFHLYHVDLGVMMITTTIVMMMMMIIMMMEFTLCK